MGDRGNIQLHYGPDQDIYLYTHWEGSELPSVLARALERGENRWEDAAYLARIIFCEMIKDDVLGETGYGLSPWRIGDEHPMLVVDLSIQRVSREDDERRWTFPDFIAVASTLK